MASRVKGRLHSIQPFTERAQYLLEHGETVSTFCHRVDWMHDGKPDTRRMARALALEPYVCGKTGRRQYKTLVQEDTARELAIALRCDPWELGF